MPAVPRLQRLALPGICYYDEQVLQYPWRHLQVYLARWQETDVAVKVITQMQNLSFVQGVHPQDPVTMSTWFSVAIDIDLVCVSCCKVVDDICCVPNLLFHIGM